MRGAGKEGPILRYTGISRIAWPGMRSEYAVLGPHSAVTTTGPHQVGIDFSGHRGLVREVAGRTERHDAEPGAVYVTGHGPITWLEVTERTEAVEIYPDRALVDRLAGDTAEVRPSYAVRDGVVFAVASRLRQAHLSAAPLTDIEASTLAHLLVRHLLRRYGTGQKGPGGPGPRSAPPGQLHPGAVDTVADYTRAHLAGEITLDALAAEVSLSPYHFARSFRATTGLTPHAFVTEHRLMVARDRLLRSKASVPQVALSVGFSNISHFRRLFRRRYGLTPADLRRIDSYQSI
jgi:AraC family transcriptional regulator